MQRLEKNPYLPKTRTSMLYLACPHGPETEDNRQTYLPSSLVPIFSTLSVPLTELPLGVVISSAVSDASSVTQVKSSVSPTNTQTSAFSNPVLLFNLYN